MTMKDYELNEANKVNKILRDAENDFDRELIIDIIFKGICIHCGAVIDNRRCYCMRDD